MSTAAGAAKDTTTGVKQALAAADASPRVPAVPEPTKSSPEGVAPIIAAVEQTAGQATHAVVPVVTDTLQTAASVTKTVERATGTLQSAAPIAVAVERVTGTLHVAGDLSEPVTRTVDRTAGTLTAPATETLRTGAGRPAPVADTVRRATERVAPPRLVVPPVVRDLPPRVAPDIVAPAGREPVSPVIPLRAGITRPPLPPAAIVGTLRPALPGGLSAGPPPAAHVVLVVPPAGSGARHVGTVLPAMPAPDAVRGRAASGQAAVDAPGSPAPPAAPSGAGSGPAGAAASSAASLFAVLCLGGVLAAWLLWRLPLSPATRRPAAFSWLLERPG